MRVQLSACLPALGIGILLNSSHASVQWSLFVVFTFNTLINNGAECIFMCLLSICVSFLMKCLTVFAYIYREIHTHIYVYVYTQTCITVKIILKCFLCINIFFHSV